MTTNTAATVTALALLPALLAAQPRADSGRLAFVVGSNQPLMTLGDNKSDKSKLENVKVLGAVVRLRSGPIVGTSDDSGFVAGENLPIGRIQLTIKAKSYNPLNCRVEVRAGRVDTVFVELLPDHRVAVWQTTAGCRQRR